MAVPVRKPRARICAALMLGAMVLAGNAPAQPNIESVLFVGNSFTFAALSPVWRYRADSVTDLNGEGNGGVPALFSIFAEEAGLAYRVSLETSPGKTLEWHWRNKAQTLNQRWDHVVLQDYSTLDPDHPGDPAELIDYAGRLTAMLVRRNPKVDVSLTATWSRPDQIYLAAGAWHGKPIQQMALDLRRGYDRAAAHTPAIARINPVGEAFNCAIARGIADPDPYDGTAYGQINLWAFDQYHASVFGYYLEALTVFAGITGRDPRTLGREERAASELGISPDIATQLQITAWQVTRGGGCA